MIASHTHVFGTSLVNELRFGWMTEGEHKHCPEQNPIPHIKTNSNYCLAASTRWFRRFAHLA